MEELAAATMARGMDTDIKRSSYEKVKFGVVDYILVVILIAIIVFTTIIGHAAKGGIM